MTIKGLCGLNINRLVTIQNCRLHDYHGIENSVKFKMAATEIHKWPWSNNSMYRLYLNQVLTLRCRSVYGVRA